MFYNIITNLAGVIGSLIPTKEEKEIVAGREVTALNETSKAIKAVETPKLNTAEAIPVSRPCDEIRVRTNGKVTTVRVPLQEPTPEEIENAEFIMENAFAIMEADIEEQIRIGENQVITDEILAELDAMMKKPEPKPLTEEEKKQKEIDERNEAFYKEYLALVEARRHDPTYRQVKEQGVYVPSESDMRRYRNNKKMVDEMFGYDLEEHEKELKRLEIENNSTRPRTPEEMGWVKEEEHIPTPMEIWEAERRKEEQEIYEEWLMLG